jgi:hypothetical protein
MKATRTFAAAALLIDETDRVGQHRMSYSLFWLVRRGSNQEIANGNSE